MLEVWKDHHLHNADDLAVGVCDEHVTSTTASLLDRCPVRVNVVLVLGLGCQRAALDDEGRRGDVVVLNGADREIHD